MHGTLLLTPKYTTKSTEIYLRLIQIWEACYVFCQVEEFIFRDPFMKVIVCQFLWYRPFLKIGKFKLMSCLVETNLFFEIKLPLCKQSTLV